MFPRSPASRRLAGFQLIAIAALVVLLSAAARAQVVISQVYGGNGNGYDRDYVELFNRGATAVSLSGWSVQYSSATGSGLFSGNGITSLSGTLAPGQYALVGLGPTSATGAALPALDVSGSTATNLSGSNGKVVLVNGMTGLACNGGSTPCSPVQLAQILDLVGYGSADFFEGNGAAPTASTTTAELRLANGCIDTNHNDVDFAIGAPAPRNSLAPHRPCPTGTTVELSVAPGAGSEAAGTVIQVTATASAPVVGDQTVDLSVSGANVTAGDYVLSSSTLTIPDGVTTGSETFTIVDDALPESAEIATLALSNPSPGLVIGFVPSRTVTIADDDSCGGPVTPVHAVQGGGNSTPLAGDVVSVEAIVVGRFQGASTDSLQGFFVQEEDADTDVDPDTSEGIFVYEGDDGVGAGIQVGDRVRVTGTASELHGTTELTSLAGVEICASGEPIPTAASLVLPVPGVPNGDLTAATAAIDAYYEAFEGMRVTIPATLSVSEYFELERFGEIVLSQGGRVPTFTDRALPSVAGLVDHRIDVAKRRVVLDDRDDRQNSALANGTPLPYPQPGLSVSNRFRGGDTITDLTGVLDWLSADGWRIRPVPELSSYTFTPANPRPASPPALSGRLELASFNVLNYFASLHTGPQICGPSGGLECRGANSAAERTRQTDKLVASLCELESDIVGLMEIQNDGGAAIDDLVQAANAVAGCGPYAAISTGTIGTDAIKVGLLFKSSTIAPVGPFALLDSGVDPRFLDTRNRPTLAQTFVELATNEKLTVAVNHLKSKGSACADLGDPDTGDGQGNCNLTRTDAAAALVDWLATDPTASGDPDFLILGDLNSYAKEDPIRSVIAGPDDEIGTSDDYVDLIDAHDGPAAYGYVFDGQIGRLDHALASPSLAAQVVGATHWHINADEPPSFDYNDTILDPGEPSFEAKPSALSLYAPDPFRSSDHDPVVVVLPEPGPCAAIGVGLFGWVLAARHRSNAPRQSGRDGGLRRP